MKLILSKYIEILATEPVLKDIELNYTYPNPKYDEAKRQGYSVRNISRLIKLSNPTETGLIIPIGLLNDLLNHYPNIDIQNKRTTVPVKIPFLGNLRSYQDMFASQAYAAQGGVMVAATGAGKTVSGIALASRLSQRCLILVKSKDLAEQWRGAIRQFTGLDAGLIGGGKDNEGEQFTIALVQTLVKRDLSELNYGLVIADECHNAPANQFYQVLNGINARYKYGLSATPQRRDNLEFMIHAALGEICTEIKQSDLGGKVLPVKVHPIHHPFNANVESWTEFIGALATDEYRNDLIVRITKKQVKPTIILTATVKHAQTLATLIQETSRLNPLLIHGQLPAKVRTERMKKAPDSNLIIGTASLLSEGIDWPHLTVLIFGAPMSAVINKANPAATKLIQSIGRCRRPYPDKEQALVIDIVDQCGFGISAWKKRRHIYNQQNFMVAA